MRRALLLVLLALTTVPAAAGDQRKTLGKPVPAATDVELTTLAKDPSVYLGKSVRVAGTVVEVDPKGAWIDIANDPEMRMRIRVLSDVKEFATDVTGRHLVAEGVVAKVAPSRTSGKEPGADDLTAAGSAAGGPGPGTVAYEIRASGLVLE